MREAQRRKMEHLRVMVERMRQHRERYNIWGVRRRERQLQLLQERVVGQEDKDNREMVHEEEGARFLARNVGRE